MSSHSYDSTCPNCGNEEMCTNEDSFPFKNIDHNCTNCGFYTLTSQNYQDLDQLNEDREVNGEVPLKELPEQKSF